MALFGYGMRSKGYKFSGDIAIIIGLAGIPITIFYDKILSWYNEMEYAQISKPWFLKDHMDIYTTFFAIGICFVGILLIIWHNIYRTRLPT